MVNHHFETVLLLVRRGRANVQARMVDNHGRRLGGSSEGQGNQKRRRTEKGFRARKRVEFLCNIDDAKHTTRSRENPESVSTADQDGLFKATTSVRAAFKNAGLDIGDARLLFVTNRNGVACPTSNSEIARKLQSSKTAARKLFPGVDVELLNRDSFDFGPFSDILAARRQS